MVAGSLSTAPPDRAAPFRLPLLVCYHNQIIAPLLPLTPLGKACYAHFIPIVYVDRWRGRNRGRLGVCSMDELAEALTEEGVKPWVCCGSCPVAATSESNGISTKSNRTIQKP